jgi:hypothetical protein
MNLVMKCGCPMAEDESERVFGKKAEKVGDWLTAPSTVTSGSPRGRRPRGT